MMAVMLTIGGTALADGVGHHPAPRDVRAVERVLAGAGIRVEVLLRRHAEAGKGGPFVPAMPPAPDRWDRLQRALRVLPLAAPLAEYDVTSGFGRRVDPLNGRRAMHAGVDLRARLRATVRATAPGRVVFAGRRGGFGRMVEIDHGLGVHTRYAHLAAITVRQGQLVPLGKRVGLLGSSGRSTGPHLHYEVLVDGRARNPQPFLKAGLRLRPPPGQR
ncbi:MAG TPA: M23 family metallopeptidase [Magnetospirillum sp.]|nr:M23 family metallopeptidase [Magnetospirillum sp.]